MVSSAIWKKPCTSEFCLLLLMYMKKFRVNYIFICSQTFILISQHVYSVVIENSQRNIHML